MDSDELGINMTVNDTILSGKRPNIRMNILRDWLIWILRSPNRNTAYTNHSTLRYSKTIQMLNGKRTRQNLFLSNQPNRYMGENTNNQDWILLPGETIFDTVNDKPYNLIEEENYQE